MLVVSADDLRAELSATVLGQDDTEYVVAHDAETGWESARAHQPQLVIVALGGAEPALALIRRIRDDERTRSVGLLVLLPSVLPPEEETLRRAGAGAVLVGRVDPFRWNKPLERLLGIAARRATMIPVRLWVWYRFAPEEKPASGLACNISVHGMLIEAEEPVDVEHGTRVETEFSLPGREQTLRALARVVREAGETPEGRRRFGIEFLKLSPEAHDKIAAFVEAEQAR